MEKKKRIWTIIGLVIFIALVGGVSYSFFVYNKDVADVSLAVGDIALDVSNINGTISLTNVVPKIDSEGMTSSNYIDFTVTGTVDTEKIYYEVYILPKSNSTLDTSYLKTYLTDQTNATLSNVTIYNNLADSESGTGGKAIYCGLIDLNSGRTTKTETKNFRLRLWLDEDYPASTAKIFEFDLYVYAYNVSEDLNSNSFYNKIANLASTADYVSTYSGNHNDTVFGSGISPIYYYTGANAADNSNVYFAGFCWQIVRTTDDGGVKLAFNGQADANEECGADRDPIIGIKGGTVTQLTALTASYSYGKSFTYNESTKKIELQDKFTATWSDDTYKDLIGTYTCKNATGSNCTTVYYVGHYQSSTQASTAPYTIAAATSYRAIGTSAINAFYDSPALDGYMYNEVYLMKTGLKEGNHLYGSDVTYANNQYTVTSTQATHDGTHHYTCDSDVENETTCDKVRYYYRDYTNTSTGDITYYYIVLENGKKIADALKEMINYKASASEQDHNLNKYNSAAKGMIENWYRHSLIDYTSYLDLNTIYCNDRSTTSIGGFSPSGSLTSYIAFYQSTSRSVLTCANKLDSFSVKNSSAKLEFPIGMLTETERVLMGVDYAPIGVTYWTMSPYRYTTNAANMRYVQVAGTSSASGSYNRYAIRPVITLKPGITVTGAGTTTSPYKIS